MTSKTNNAMTIEGILDFLGFPADGRIAVPINDKLRTEVPVRAICIGNPEMLKVAAINGFTGKLGNVSKGGLKAKLGREASDADLATARAKIVSDAWLKGTWNLSGSGPRDSLVGEMNDAYINKQVTQGFTVAQAIAKKRNTVTAAFGKDEKATFPRFLDAVATLKCKADSSLDYDETRAALEAAAMEAVEADRARAAEASKELDIDISNLF